MYGGYEDYGGYEGGWAPENYLTGANADFPMTRYQNKSGHDYLDFKQWALEKEADTGRRDKMLQNIYLSAKAMKFHPQITKDLRKTYGLVASAAMRAMTPEGKFIVKKAMSPYSGAMGKPREDIAADKVARGLYARKGLAGRIAYWNLIQDTDITKLEDAVQALYGVKPSFKSAKGFKAKDCVCWHLCRLQDSVEGETSRSQRIHEQNDRCTEEGLQAQTQGVAGS